MNPWLAHLVEEGMAAARPIFLERNPGQNLNPQLKFKAGKVQLMTNVATDCRVRDCTGLFKNRLLHITPI